MSFIISLCLQWVRSEEEPKMQVQGEIKAASAMAGQIFSNEDLMIRELFPLMI